MATKFFQIFIKILAILLLFVAIYILAVFVFPDFTDTYGNSDFNTILRELKDKSLQISSPDGSLNNPF